ncbi:class I SAM-dependent RNA methyltransferase [Candidatus Saccharibacteria bacterium]|nr:class I SAM-dependent RNA methyltransferase [Candidatus Saccharibacteria bacterium]
MQAKIDKLVPGGQSIATLENGKKAFIWGALPGEIVEFETTKDKRSYCEGIATKVLQAAPERIAPQDDCYLATSPWQILDYTEELKQKSIITKECFLQQHLNLEVQPTITDGKDFGYRNKMEYSLYWSHDDNKIHLAFHSRGTHRKTPIERSSIERPEIFAKAQAIVDDLNAQHAEARTYQSLLIRCDQTGKTSAALFENGKSHPQMDTLKDTLNGYEYSYSPNGFFQINLPVYELALKEIAQHITTNQVLDLYAGVGSIGLSVARDKELTLVEVNGAAFAEMEENAKQAPHAKCVLAKSEDVTEYITPDCIVILDPPRAGCDQKLIDKLNEVKPAKIIYLSCNPITQARDIALLTDNYHVDKLQPYNFFPRTPHVENLAILSQI